MNKEEAKEQYRYLLEKPHFYQNCMITELSIVPKRYFTEAKNLFDSRRIKGSQLENSFQEEDGDYEALAVLVNHRTGERGITPANNTGITAS